MPWKTDLRRPPSRRVRPQQNRQRHHGTRQPFDRRELERSGWRTTLEYRENLERGRDGVLGAVECEWYAEGEQLDDHGDVVVVSACGSTPSSAWSRLRATADLVPIRAQGRPARPR